MLQFNEYGISYNVYNKKKNLRTLNALTNLRYSYINFLKSIKIILSAWSKRYNNKHYTSNVNDNRWENMDYMWVIIVFTAVREALNSILRYYRFFFESDVNIVAAVCLTLCKYTKYYMPKNWLKKKKKKRKSTKSGFEITKILNNLFIFSRRIILWQFFCSRWFTFIVP